MSFISAFAGHFIPFLWCTQYIQNAFYVRKYDHIIETTCDKYKIIWSKLYQMNLKTHVEEKKS